MPEKQYTLEEALTILTATIHRVFRCRPVTCRVDLQTRDGHAIEKPLRFYLAGIHGDLEYERLFPPVEPKK